MRPLIAIATSLVWITLAASSAGGQETASFEYGRHSFEITVPAGYSFFSEASPRAGFKVFGFATAQRADGTRGMFQVGILDFAESGIPEPSLDEWMTGMADSIRRDRTDWASSKSNVTLDGVPAQRVEWSAKMTVERDDVAKTFPIRGVVYVGIKKEGVGFTVSTQDILPLADETVPICDRALQSFRLTSEAASAASAASSAGGQETASFEYGRHSFELTVPAGYQPSGEDSPKAGVKLFRFATGQRAEGIPGIFQVLIFDFAAAGQR